MILANVFSDPSSASSIGWVLLSLAALAVAANSIANFWRENIREKPIPSATYATKDEHHKLREQLDAELGRERGSRKLMHQEIAVLQAATATLHTEVEAYSKQLDEVKEGLGEIHKRIDEVPKRLLDILQTTKDLHR